MRKLTAGLGIALAAALALSGCATGAGQRPLKIDAKTHRAEVQESRVRYIIVHYTALDFERSVRELTRGNVSSHYLIADDPKATIYLLVDEDRRAWHAGQSSWRGETALNSASIGIEIVNAGGGEARDPGVFAPFSEAQMANAIALVADIARRHEVLPHRILGHGEIAPMRRVDPGPLFPWRRLHEAGVVPWPSDAAIAAATERFAQALPDAAWVQERLLRHGFAIVATGQWDELTEAALRNFQVRYRPARYDGQLDLETAALLAAATEPGGLVVRAADGSLIPYDPDARRVRPLADGLKPRPWRLTAPN
jgi:N-acetylmuramoyl-L-alanine amidase